MGPGDDTAGRVRVRRLTTSELSAGDIASIRALMAEAFGDGDEAFGDHDWDHALGGIHIVLDIEDVVVAHAAVVERDIHVAGRPLRAGYVEAVATATDQQGRGFGSQVMEAAGSVITREYDLGVLGTGRHQFYERLGWRTWQGPAFVRTARRRPAHTR